MKRFLAGLAIAVALWSGVAFAQQGNVVNLPPAVGGGQAPCNAFGAAGGNCQGGFALNVMNYGALGNNSADDTTAIQAAITALGSGGGTVIFPPGNYCIKTGPLTVTQAGITLKGQNRQAGSTLKTCGQDVSIISATATHTEIERLSLQGSNVLSTTKPTISFGSGCVECTVRDSLVLFGQNAINANGAGEINIYDSKLLEAYGSAVVYLATTGGHIWRTKIDQSWPVSQPTFNSVTLSAWQATTAYTAGNLVTNNGFILQASVGGTSGGSAPTNPAYGGSVVDGGTLTWVLVGPTTYYGIQCDTGCGNALIIDGNTDLTGSFSSGIGFTNTLAGATPAGIIINNATPTQNLNSSIYLGAGTRIQIGSSALGSCEASGCNLIDVESGFTGDLTVENNIFTGGATGVFLNASARHTIVGNDFRSVTTGVSAAAGIGNFNVAGNLMQNLTTGVSIAAGSSDFYYIIGNNFNGTTTPISDSGTGTHKVLQSSTQLAFGSAVSLGLNGNALQASGAGSATVTVPAATSTLLSTAGATLQGAPSNPTGTASTTPVMAGMGTTCTITPLYSGRIRFTMVGVLSNSTSGDGTLVKMVYGTGTAPINGAAASGSSIGKLTEVSSVSANNAAYPFALDGIVSGFSTGTAVWFDLQQNAVTGGTAAITNASCSAAEM